MSERDQDQLWLTAERARALVDPYPMPYWHHPVGLAQVVMSYLDDHPQAALVSDAELLVAAIEEYWGPPGQRELWGEYVRERYERALRERSGSAPPTRVSEPWERAAGIVDDARAEVFCAAVAALRDETTTPENLAAVIRGSAWSRSQPAEAQSIQLEYVADGLAPNRPELPRGLDTDEEIPEIPF